MFTSSARVAVALAVPALLISGLVGAQPALAAGPPIKAYANCTAMHKVNAYPRCIKKVGANDRRTDGGHAKYAPYVSTKRYNLHTKSDRDHHGVAC